MTNWEKNKLKRTKILEILEKLGILNKIHYKPLEKHRVLINLSI